jgi:hypothetical protein
MLNNLAPPVAHAEQEQAQLCGRRLALRVDRQALTNLARERAHGCVASSSLQDPLRDLSVAQLRRQDQAEYGATCVSPTTVPLQLHFLPRSAPATP